jgi:hypothetical protein
MRRFVLKSWAFSLPKESFNSIFLCDKTVVGVDVECSVGGGGGGGGGVDVRVAKEDKWANPTPSP